MSAAQPVSDLRWFTTAAGLDQDEQREQPEVVCHVRPDFDNCLTAEVSQLADGRWRARLFSHTDSFTEITRTHRIAVERLAEEHSDRLTRETFFAEPQPEAAQ